MRWRTFTLYKLTTERDTRTGQHIETYKPNDRIDVMTSTKMYTAIENDVLYRKFESTGVTRYGKFNKVDSYIIELDNMQYKITGINYDGRYVQLTLEETSLVLDKHNYDLFFSGVFDGTVDMYFDGLFTFSGVGDNLG